MPLIVLLMMLLLPVTVTLFPTKSVPFMSVSLRRFRPSSTKFATVREAWKTVSVRLVCLMIPWMLAEQLPPVGAESPYTSESMSPRKTWYSPSKVGLTSAAVPDVMTTEG